MPPASGHRGDGSPPTLQPAGGPDRSNQPIPQVPLLSSCWVGGRLRGNPGAIEAFAGRSAGSRLGPVNILLPLSRRPKLLLVTGSSPLMSSAGGVRGQTSSSRPGTQTSSWGGRPPSSSVPELRPAGGSREAQPWLRTGSKLGGRLERAPGCCFLFSVGVAGESAVLAARPAECIPARRV